MSRELLNTDDLSLNDINRIFQKAREFYSHPNNLTTARYGEDIALCFWENSTRTRVSFELAAKHLNHRPMYLYAKHSSAEKGESLLDTLLTLYATGIRCFVVRHPQDQYYLNLMNDLPKDVVLINAGDGKQGHPSQALLDVFTLQQNNVSLAGLKVLFVGDVAHSRVVRSNVKLMHKMQAQCWAYVPEFLQSKETIANLEYKDDLDQAIATCDVVMMLRAQDERWSEQVIAQHNLHTENKSYLKKYGLDKQRLKLLRSNAFILHPGPFRRNVEIDEVVLQDSRCLIWKQVKNGVFIRMAIFDTLLGGHT
ncbi:MAG TPA: aspartate carbamoyltransferase catalytic subunit [Oligoflexia bacterium]|nr:aspartate carbamoyltransferase catalytic subunit [Oligoflexia bacterium]HMR24915.1 aspartate carbamoyltransferase catalytic subunit [Oligoflexia bacterium]